MTAPLKAAPGCCEEASPQSTDTYIPCNRPAKRLIRHRGEGDYRMCAACASHNITRRGAEDLGFYPVPAERAST